MFFKKKEISNHDIKKIPRSYEVVGDILIFSDFPKELNKKEKTIGEYLIKTLKNINVVTKKTKSFSGKYRTQKLKIIAGEKRKETIHKENGVKIKVNPEKAYFSVKSATERLRIANLIKKQEKVLVMFSGVAPFPLTIAKHSKAKEIYGIEINPIAHKYAEENIKVFKGDVNKILPKLNEKFNRIVMPLPKTSEKYFDLALKYINPKGKIHLYIFEREDNFKKLKEKYQKYNPKIIKAGSPSPGNYRVCLDLNLK